MYRLKKVLIIERKEEIENLIILDCEKNRVFLWNGIWDNLFLCEI